MSWPFEINIESLLEEIYSDFEKYYILDLKVESKKKKTILNAQQDEYGSEEENDNDPTKKKQKHNRSTEA